MHTRLRPALLLACLLPALPAAALELRASVDGAPPRPGRVRALRGQQVVLHAHAVPAGAALRWFKVEPTAAALDNTRPRFHFAPIPYARTELTACRDRTACPADVEPVAGPRGARVAGTGTMAFQLEAHLPDGRVVATPGPERRVRGGLAPDVMRVTFRQDDSYLGHLTELFNVPYVFGSAGDASRPDDHQTDNLVGVDCADLVVYGQRRLGRALPYLGSHQLGQVARPAWDARAEGPDGVARGPDGQPLRWGARGVRAGDVLHFPGTRHVGVLWEDRGTPGVLDAADLMLHTCWAAPTLQALGETGCASYPVRAYRFESTR